MSQYTEFVKGMLDNCNKSKAYWCAQKEIFDNYLSYGNNIKSIEMICDKLIALDRDIELLNAVLRQFEEYDNES